MRLTLAVALAVVSAALGEAAAPLTPDPPRSSTTPRYSPPRVHSSADLRCEDSVTLVLQSQALTPAPEMAGEVSRCQRPVANSVAATVYCVGGARCSMGRQALDRLIDLIGEAGVFPTRAKSLRFDLQQRPHAEERVGAF